MIKKSEVWGVTYWGADDNDVRAYPNFKRDRYYYNAFLRSPFRVDEGDSAFVIRAPEDESELCFAEAIRGGDVVINDALFAVVIRGLMVEDQDRGVTRATYLPYVNGCSTKQIFPPERAGDPTLQYLEIPPNSAEQAHHIHSTTRVVYIAAGKGVSVVGMDQKTETTDLLPGMMCILEPMCPHHFETPYGQPLVCLPVHVWSSVGVGEYNHPMFNGTHLMNQGG